MAHDLAELGLRGGSTCAWERLARRIGKKIMNTKPAARRKLDELIKAKLSTIGSDGNSLILDAGYSIRAAGCSILDA